MHSRLFASNGHPRPQDGSKMAQEGPKRGPREPQDGPKSAQERSKSAPRGPQDGMFEPPREGQELTPPLFLINACLSAVIDWFFFTVYDMDRAICSSNERFSLLFETELLEGEILTMHTSVVSRVQLMHVLETSK